METQSVKTPLISDAKARLSDIIIEVSWLEIAHKYFGKSASWLYHKLDGIRSDGSKGGGFTPSEAEQLKFALNDLADRIRTAAERI